MAFTLFNLEGTLSGTRTEPSEAGLFGRGAVSYTHLGIESFGVSYLTPFASNAGEQVEGHAVFRQPLPQVKQRPAALKTRNRRNQK